MSTRSVVATTHGDGWRGLYCHYDGYPTCLGPRLWTALRACGFDRDRFEAEVLTPHPGGYMSFPDTCHCHDPQHDSTTVMIYTEADEEAYALCIEWVYVVGRDVLTISTSMPTGADRRCQDADGRWWMEPAYGWVVVTQVRLDGPEPDWQAIEDAAATNPPAPVAQALAQRL
jgi:hypothetical protein